MAYTPLTWVDGTTSANATNLNHLEAGVAAAALVNAGQMLTKSGAWVGSSSGAATGTINPGDGFAVPVAVGSAGASFDRVAITVGTASSAGGLVRLGVYADSSGYPGSLIADWGTVAVDTTGDKIITISWAPAAGLYWLASASLVASCDVRVSSGQSSPFALSSMSLANAGNGVVSGYTMSGISSTLPGTWSTTLSEKYVVPRVFLRSV